MAASHGCGAWWRPQMFPCRGLCWGGDRYLWAAVLLAAAPLRPPSLEFVPMPKKQIVFERTAATGEPAVKLPTHSRR